MWKQLSLMLGLLWVLLPAGLAAQAQVEGDWDVTFHRGEESVEALMTLERDADAVAGRVANEQMSFEVDCAVRRDELECVGEVDDGGSDVVAIILRGVVEDGEITGTADYGDWGRGDWVAKRR